MCLSKEVKFCIGFAKIEILGKSKAVAVTVRREKCVSEKM